MDILIDDSILLHKPPSSINEARVNEKSNNIIPTKHAWVPATQLAKSAIFQLEYPTSLRRPILDPNEQLAACLPMTSTICRSSSAGLRRLRGGVFDLTGPDYRKCRQGTFKI
jgi:hypothetical protein